MRNFFISSLAALALSACAQVSDEPRETRSATKAEREALANMLNNPEPCIKRLERTMPDKLNGDILMGCDCIRTTFAEYLDDDIVIFAVRDPHAFVNGPTPRWLAPKAGRALRATGELAYRACGMKYE